MVWLALVTGLISNSNVMFRKIFIFLCFQFNVLQLIRFPIDAMYFYVSRCFPDECVR